MVDFDVTTYVNANKVTCAVNCIKNYLWDGIPFDNTLKKIAEVEPNFPHYYNKRLSAATKKELEKSSCDLDYFKKILNKDRKTYVYPSYNKLTDEQKKIIDDCIEKCLNHHISYEEFSLSNLDNKDNTPIQELSEKINQFTGRPVSKDNRQYIKLLQYTLSEKFKKFNEPLKVETDYYQNAQLLDGVYSKDDKRYWHSNEEMFARAFACYVKDKLSPNRSDYLCGHAESCSCSVDGKEVKAYPEGIERKNINNCFDKLIELAKNKGLFAEYNQENVVFNYHLDMKNFEDKSINDNIEQLSFTDLIFPDTEIDIEENY